MESVTHERSSGFVVCVSNDGYELDLEPRKVYEVVPDDTLEPNDIRVIDESGEDYVYPADYFSPIETFRGSVAANTPQTDIEREALGFIEEHEPLLTKGSSTVLGRAFVQGANVFTALTKEVMEASKEAVSAKNALAEAIRNPATPARRLQELEEEEARATNAYKRLAASSQRLDDFLRRIQEMLPGSK